MESVNKKVVFIALLMAIFTAFLVYVYIKKVTTSPETVQYVNVYVAARTLPAKHRITNADIRQVKVTREYINTKAILNKADIVEKRLKDSIIEGEQILRDRLVDDNKAGIAYSVAKGKRAVSVNINEQSGVANLLKPGDFVDVVAGFDIDKDEGYVKSAKTIIQNSQILAVGQEEQIIDEEKKKDMPKTVTLEVTPQDAEKLVYASEFGVIRLALRTIDDNTDAKTDGVIKGDIVPSKSIITKAFKEMATK